MANQEMLETAAIWGGLSLWLLILWGGLHFVLGYVGRCSRKRSSSPSKPFVVEGKAVHRKSATPWVSCWETIKGCMQFLPYLSGRSPKGITSCRDNSDNHYRPSRYSSGYKFPYSAAECIWISHLHQSSTHTETLPKPEVKVIIKLFNSIKRILSGKPFLAR